jgi:hypothetical protein
MLDPRVVRAELLRVRSRAGGPVAIGVLRTPPDGPGPEQR